MPSLKIHGFPPSTYTQTALMVAAEAGAETALQPLDFKNPSHFALHPYGKMPVLEHDEVTLFETLAIVIYIDSAIGGARLQPTETIGRARMFQWISVAIDYAYEDLVDGLHDETPSAEAVTRAAEQLRLLDARLADVTNFAGDSFTLADLFLFPMVEHAVRKLGEQSVRALPHLVRWRSAVSNRPSATRAA